MVTERQRELRRRRKRREKRLKARIREAIRRARASKAKAQKAQPLEDRVPGGGTSGEAGP